MTSPPRRPGRPQRWTAVALLLVASCSSAGDGSDGADPLAPGVTSMVEDGDTGYGSRFESPVVLGNLADPAATESSGLVASRRNPGLYWTHNDSGDAPFLYCVRGAGESCGVWRVAGVEEARDWEDIAAGPGPDPDRPYLYVGDIGDNLVDQEQFSVYRVVEPEVRPGGPASTTGAPSSTEPATRLQLRYPDGPHDAEALMVHPVTGDLYVVAKEAAPTVYVARAPLTAGSVATLERVQVLAIAEGEGPRAGHVTGGDISPDGRRVVLCTYLSGYELELPREESRFDAIWKQPLHPFSVGARVQGEAVAYRLDGDAVLTTSERAGGLPAPLQQVERRP